MDRDARQLGLLQTGKAKLQPLVKQVSAQINTVIYRITDDSAPWTYDNAPAWLHSSLAWLWSWGLLLFLGFSAGVAISVLFLTAF